LRGQRRAAHRTAPDRHLHQRAMPQPVDGIVVARRQSPRRAPSPSRTSRDGCGSHRGDPASLRQAARKCLACAPPASAAADRNRGLVAAARITVSLLRRTDARDGNSPNVGDRPDEVSDHPPSDGQSNAAADRRRAHPVAARQRHDCLFQGRRRDGSPQPDRSGRRDGVAATVGTIPADAQLLAQITTVFNVIVPDQRRDATVPETSVGPQLPRPLCNTSRKRGGPAAPSSTFRL